MSYKVFYSDPDVTAEAGFGRVARIPCIFDSSPRYHRLGSRYLIDRGLAVWNPRTHDKVQAIPPTDSTMRNYAYWLANFLEWAETRGVELVTCKYAEHIHSRYQREMLEGIWSRDGIALEPSTVNLRVQQACDFLTWMSNKEHRKPFDIPFETVRTKVQSPTSSTSHRTNEVQVRKGKVRQKKRRLRMPTDDQVGQWLCRVDEKFGAAKALMCETILLTAVRREEVACWRVETLPNDPKEWHINNSAAPRSEQRVLVDIRFGTKGPGYGYDHGDKIGPERSIWVPLGLAERLHEYGQRLRNTALRRWVKSATTLEEKKLRIERAVHLFISDDTGTRITGKDLYNCWTGVELPFKGWSPHLGRDWWSCSILWKEMKKHENLILLGINAPAALLESVALSVIRLVIQPQLGHAQDSTTMTYLQWIADTIGFNLSIRYEAELDNANPTE